MSALLPLTHCPPPFELPGALAVIVVERVSGNEIHGALDRRGADGFSDHHGEFDFPIGLLRGFRDGQAVVRAGDRGGRFEKKDRLGRDGHIAFPGMVAVVETNADDLAGPRDAAGFAVGHP